VSKVIFVEDELKKINTKLNNLERKYQMLFKYVKQNWGAITLIQEKMDKRKE
jgi:hypothetical protein